MTTIITTEQFSNVIVQENATVIRNNDKGVRTRELDLPAHCLDRWYAAKNLTNTQLVEVPVFGDSTTWGQASDGAGGTTYYSWLQALKDLALASGCKDGGRGFVDFADTFSSLSPDGYASQISKGAWVATPDWGPLFTNGYTSNNTSGAVMQLKGKGTAIRLMWTIRNQTNGAFSVSIDGGAATNYTCANTFRSIESVFIQGLTEGDHTVTITALDAGLISVAVAFQRSSGLVFHKIAQMGKRLADTWNGQSNLNGAANLGLSALPTYFNGVGFQFPAQTSPRFPRPPLAILFMGLNDMADAGTTDSLAQTGVFKMQQAIGSFAITCQAAETDGLVILPDLKNAPSAYLYAGPYKQALAATTRACGLGLVDISYILGTNAQSEAAGYSYQGNVHLRPTGYQRWAKWIWENVLNRPVAP